MNFGAAYPTAKAPGPLKRVPCLLGLVASTTLPAAENDPGIGCTLHEASITVIRTFPARHFDARSQHQITSLGLHDPKHRRMLAVLDLDLVPRRLGRHGSNFGLDMGI